MSESSRSLQHRIESLERQNRRMRFVGGAGLVAALAAGLMSFAAPAVCKTVWGERIVLRDGHGKDRMVLDAYGKRTPSLTVKNSEGRSVAELSIEDDGEMNLSVFKEGKMVPARVHVGAAGDAAGACCDKTEKDKDTVN